MIIKRVLKVIWWAIVLAWGLTLWTAAILIISLAVRLSQLAGG